MQNLWLGMFAGGMVGGIAVFTLFLLWHRRVLATQLTTLDRDKSAAVEQQKWLKEQWQKNQDHLTEEQRQVRELLADQARLKTELSHAQIQLSSQKEELLAIQSRLTAEFRNLANEIMEEKSQKFTQQNQTNLTALLQPLQENINQYQQRIDINREADTQHRAALFEQIKSLSDLNQQVTAEAHQLTQALKGQSKVQGDWGEMILEQIMEQSGLEKDLNYSTQSSYRDENNQLKRPDMIINLPDGKHLIVDAKVSLTAYSNAAAAESPEAQKKFLDKHLDSVRGHINELAEKNYQQLSKVNSPDFVLMFIPIEAAFAAAFRARPELHTEAFKKNIVIVTASTLMATLRIVKNIWQQEKQNSNAEEIARQSGLLYDRFVTLTNDLEILGQRFNTVQTQYDTIMKRVATGRGNLISRAEKIKALGAATSKNLASELIHRAADERDRENLISSNAEDDD